MPEVEGSRSSRLKSTAIFFGAAIVTAFAMVVSRQLEDRPSERADAERASAPRPRRPFLPASSYWKRVLVLTYREINDDRLLALAAGVVFYAMLSLFPALGALISSYALFADPSTIFVHLAQLSSSMPSAVFELVNEQARRLVGSTTDKLSFAFVIGFLLSIWSANAGVKAIIDALNIVYGRRERRSFLRLNLLSLVFTTGAIMAILLAFATVVAVPMFFSLFKVPSSVIGSLRWPAFVCTALLSLAALYRFGPDLDNPRWRVFTPGALVATFGWIGGSAALSYYLGHFANYDATYGSLGAGIGLMMWLWVMAISILIGAELDSVIDELDDGASAFPPANPDRIGGF